MWYVKKIEAITSSVVASVLDKMRLFKTIHSSYSSLFIIL